MSDPELAPITTAPDPTPAPVLKPGWRTSEAWFTLVVIVLGAIPNSGLVDNSPLAAKLVGLVASVLAALGYQTQRTKLKIAHAANDNARATTVRSRVTTGAAVLALAGLASWGVVGGAGCASVQKMTGSFSACASADLGRAVDPGASSALAGLTAADLLSFVTEIVTANTGELEAQLAALAATVGLDALDCAIAAIEAVENAPTPGSGSAPATLAADSSKRDQGIYRMRAYVKTRRAGGK
jgi:hypothetical protein